MPQIRVLAVARTYQVEAIQAQSMFTVETPGGQETVHVGDWVVMRDGKRYVYTDEKFLNDFEPAVDFSDSFVVEEFDVRPELTSGSPGTSIEATLRLVDSDGDGSVDSVEVVGDER